MSGPCRLCAAATDRRLFGEATVGEKRGTYDLFICPGCWYLFEKQGVGREDVERAIREQVAAA